MAVHSLFVTAHTITQKIASQVEAMPTGLTLKACATCVQWEPDGGFDVAFAIHGSTVRTRCNHMLKNKLWGAS
jgi:hypothetical protein